MGGATLEGSPCWRHRCDNSGGLQCRRGHCGRPGARRHRQDSSGWKHCGRKRRGRRCRMTQRLETETLRRDVLAEPLRTAAKRLEVRKGGQQLDQAIGRGRVLDRRQTAGGATFSGGWTGLQWTTAGYQRSPWGSTAVAVVREGR